MSWRPSARVRPPRDPPGNVIADRDSTTSGKLKKMDSDNNTRYSWESFIISSYVNI